MVGRIDGPWDPALDSAGVPLSGAKLETFDSVATTTPRTTYSDTALTVPHANPVVADSAGRFPQIWAAEGAGFYLVLKSAAGVTIASWGSIVALGTSATGVIERDEGADGRLQIYAEAGVANFEGGDPDPDDVGGAVRIGGWDGTQADTIELDAAAVNVTGALTIDGEAVSPTTISSGSVSAATAADIPLAPGYRNHRVTLMQVQPATDNQNIWAQFSFDNGATYKAGAADYWDLLQATIDSAGAAIGGLGGNAVSAVRIALALSNGAAYNNQIVLDIATPDGETAATSLVASGGYIRTGGNRGASVVRGGTNNLGYGDADHVRIRAASGNISLRYSVMSY